MAGMDLSAVFRMDGLSSVDSRAPSGTPSGKQGGQPSFASVLAEVRARHDPNIVPVNTPPAPRLPDRTTLDGHIMGDKIQKGMGRRGWTPEEIDRAVRHEQRIDAVNKETGAPATRYVDPETGRSVVIDNTTDRVLQVGKAGDRHGPPGGDVPGAKMRPAPAPQAPEGSPDPAPGDRIIPAPEEPTVPEIPEIPPI